MRVMPILVTLGAVVVAAPAQVMAQDFEWSGRLSAGQAIEVKGINGDIEAMAASGDQVEVTAVKREGRRGYADEVTFEVLEHDDGVTICVMYPSEPGERENECRQGGHGHMSVHDNDTEVRLTVRVPAGVDFVGRTVNGNIDTGPLGGDVRAYTVNRVRLRPGEDRERLDPCQHGPGRLEWGSGLRDGEWEHHAGPPRRPERPRRGQHRER
jgi:hypothetical protein